MKVRRLSVPIVLCALMLAAAGPAQARHPERTKCTARGAHTIIATETGRIFSTARRGETQARIYGCLYSQNRRYFLGEDGDCDPGPVVGKLILIGRYVGFAETHCNIDQGEDAVVVRDLRTGREKWRAATATGTEDGAASTEVTDLVMSRTGSVAWIANWDANSGGMETPHPNDDRQVRKLEPGAPEGGTLLASGLDIEPGSLGLSSRTRGGFSWLYWQKGSATQTGKLN